MKKITKISLQQRGGRYNIFLDEEFYCGVTEATLIDLNLKKGMIVDETQLEQMIAKEHINKGVDYAIWLLGRKSYFKKELEKKLILKEYTEEEIAIIIEKIKSYGYLDDERLTVAFVGDKKRFSKKGPRYIKQSLQQKGVDRAIIEETLEEHYSDEEEFDICKGLGEKKLESYKRRESDKYKLKSKLYAYLASKGFSSDIISKVINQLEF